MTRLQTRPPLLTPGTKPLGSATERREAGESNPLREEEEEAWANTAHERGEAIFLAQNSGC